MTIFKTKQGWRVEVWVNNRRVAIKSGFVTKHKAEQWMVETKVSYDPDKASKANYTFDDLLTRYVDTHLKDLRKTTQLRYTLDIDQRIRPFFKGLGLNQISKRLIADFRDRVIAEPDLANGSVNNAVDLLRSIFNKGLEWEMLTSNPAAKIKPLKEPKIRYSWWSNQADVTTFLETAQKVCPQYFPAFRLALDLGLRAGEVNGLSKQDINFTTHQITVHRQWSDDTGQYEPLKDNEVRVLPWNPDSDLTEVLEKAIVDSPHQEALFTTETGRRILTNKLSFYWYRKVRGACEVPEITFHDLRHTFASWYLIRGGTLSDLKYMLGHANFEMVQKYAHCCVDHIRRVDLGWERPTTPNPHQARVIKIANR